MGQVLYYLVAETKNVDIKDILLNRRFREHLEVHQLQKFFFISLSCKIKRPIQQHYPFGEKMRCASLSDR